MSSKSDVYLKVYDVLSLADGYISIQCPLETLVVLSVYVYCQHPGTSIKIILERNSMRPQVSVTLNESLFSLIQPQDISWQVSSCKLPVVISDYTVITGLCAVVRHVCKLSKTTNPSEEHPEGILGFRRSCLQAPNEVSVWTKFCEVEILDTVKYLLNKSIYTNYDEFTSFEIPENMAKFEQHLGQPLRIHNVYKLARDMAKLSVNMTGSKVSKNSDTDRSIPKLNNCETKPTRSQAKQRNWKSNNSYKQIESSTPIAELELEHKFSEGPYLTLADVILYAYYCIIFSILDQAGLINYIPKTIKWFTAVQSLESMKEVNKVMSKLSINKFSISGIKLTYLMPTVKEVSLYKTDPKRSNPKKRLFTKEVDVEAALSIITDGLELKLGNNIVSNDKFKIDWMTIPSLANPYGGHLPDKRMERKTQQLENLAAAAMQLAKNGDRIVDFCSGSGHLGILLAYLLPNCIIILLENKEQSLNRAQSRVNSLGLTNVYFFQCNLDFFKGTFDIGVALHACGIATDLVLENCISKNASFVICPCCYGSLHSTDRLQYPKSKEFAALISVAQYMCIGHAADQTHVDHPMEERGARCMSLIDSDRAKHAINNGYSVSLTRLVPLSCTPKNMLIIGISGK